MEYNLDEFQYNIDNMKQDLAVENMTITDGQIKMLEQYEQGNILMSDIIDNIIGEYK